MWDQILDMYDKLHPEITVLVEADRVQEVQDRMDAADLPTRVTVKASPYVPAGHAFVVNHTETRRTTRETAVRGLRGERQ